MKTPSAILAAFLLAACGASSTDIQPTRYNFAVIDGANQASTAGAALLAKPITAQLTRDPQGKFATRVFDFLAPSIAYAQGIVLSGTPVANAIVCGREALPGEPQVVPLCAYTLADGKAANSVQPGTKAGTYNVVFSAQVPTQMPVKDSTTVTVLAGDVAKYVVARFTPVGGFVRQAGLNSTFDIHDVIASAADKYDNTIAPPYVFVPGWAVRDGTEPDANPAIPDVTGWTFAVVLNPTGKSVPDPSGNYKTRLTVYTWVAGVRDFFQLDVR
jgi:hypothetical protein